MRRSVALVVLRLAVLVALAVSAALLVDYLRPLPAFCEVGSGCDQVRASTGLGRFAWVIPATGLAGFATLMLASFGRPRWLGRALAPLAMIGGLVALGLLAWQVLFAHAFCKLCLTVDGSAVVMAISAVLVHPSDEPNDAAPRLLWALGCLFALALPTGWGLMQPAPPAPNEITRRWVPGKLNVVEFADFQCPFCRQLHPRMAEVLQEYGDQVHFVRINMPLVSHMQSRDAARAYCCADEQGKALPMADALFSAPSIAKDDDRKLAATVGLDLGAFDACIASPRVDQRLDREIAVVNEVWSTAGSKGLPMVWVGDEMILGLHPTDDLRDAFARAAEAANGRRPANPTWMWGGLVLGLAGLLAVGLRRARRETA